jgi:hypothetical protein
MPEKQQAQEVTTEVDVKTAVKAATDYFAELYSSPFADLALEEVEKAFRHGTNKWLVTLGYVPARRTASGLATLPGTPRQYKLLTVDAETGEVESMKVAKL